MIVNNYRSRIIDKKIDQFLELFGAVNIEGPKYCGKTWTGRYHLQLTINGNISSLNHILFLPFHQIYNQFLH